MARGAAVGPRASAAALTVALAAVVALGAAGCGADVESPATTPRAATDPLPTETLRAAPDVDGEAAQDSGAGTAPVPVHSAQPLALRVHRRAQLRETPGGKVVATIHTKTEFRSPTILAVAARKPGWVLVRTTLEDHHVGWLPASAGQVFEEPRTIVIDLSDRTLTLFHRGKLTDRYRVAVGTDATPTPTGRYAVTDRLKTGDENGDYGCCILALNAHQPKIAQGWGGGDRVAIHATPHTWTLGNAVSHGCVRATNKALHQLMRKVRLGTPVRIKA
jgi:lipoprotein-anchoring transpeptidase ErfK/SrfK